MGGTSLSFDDFVFTNLPLSSVNATNLTAFDTIVLLQVPTNSLTAQQKADINNFVDNGGKLIIYDSDATQGNDYSWLIRPFSTSPPCPNCGLVGGTLTIVENDTLGTNDPNDPSHYINTAEIPPYTDAVGDANVIATNDPKWFGHMKATNARGQTGWMRAYAEPPSGNGLLIYNGVDTDYIRSQSWSASRIDWLAKMWYLELKQQWNPSNLPSTTPVVGATPLTLNLTVILARASDGPQPDPTHTAAYFRDTLIPRLAQYHKDNSYGLITIHLAEIKDNGGAWYTLNNPLSSYLNNERGFVEDAIAAIAAEGVVPGTTSTDVVVVVHSGPACKNTREGCLATQTNLWQRKYPSIIVSEDDLVGAWSHEVGHDLGYFINNNLTPAILNFIPDLAYSTNMDMLDLMATGSWAGDPVGQTPTFMSSITRHTLGWLQYDSIPKADAMRTFFIGALETSQLGDTVFKIDVDSTHCYVLETRSKQYSEWDTSLKSEQAGAVLYYINTHDTDGKRPCGTLTIDASSPSCSRIVETINVKAILQLGLFGLPSIFADHGNHLMFSLLGDDASDDHYQMQLKVEPLVNNLSSFVKGVILSGGTVSHQQAIPCSAPMPPLVLPILPDLDLHLYIEDGRHVGVNYATGEFENQVLNADVSGDQFNGEEWVVVPESISGHFIVSSIRSAQFLQSFPELKASLGPTDSFTLMDVAAAPGSPPVNHEPKAQVIPIGGFMEVPLVTTRSPDGSLTVTLGQAGVSIDSLIAELSSYNAIGTIKTAGAYYGLRAKLIAAKASIQRGKRGAAVNQLAAFQNQMNADNLVESFALEPLTRDLQTLSNALQGH